MQAGRLLVVSLAFALYILCPRMTAMIVVQTKAERVNPYQAITLGALISIPLFALMVMVYLRLGVEAAIILAASADVAAAVLLGALSAKAGLELAVITLFVYAGIKAAPRLAGIILKALG